MNIPLLIATLFLVLDGPAVQEPSNQDEQSAIDSVEKILVAQVQCWNNRDLEGFMQTYWKSPKLTFSAGGKTTRGWQSTLQRYKSKYPPEKMGTLKFDNLEVSILSKDVALVLGNWQLSSKNNTESKQGNFSLVLKKMDQQWKIVHDHSSSLDE